MDETYIKVKGEWVYLYRAVDKLGKTLDFMLSKRRNKAAPTEFFARALEVNGLPRKIVIDRSGANTAGINAINRTEILRLPNPDRDGPDQLASSHPHSVHLPSSQR